MIKSKIIIGVSIILSLSFTGCVRTYYPLMYQMSPTPMVFETSDRDNRSSQYVGMDLTYANGAYENENVQILRENYVIVKTEDRVNMSARFFAYSGLYHVSGLEKYDGNKFAFGAGGDLNAAINLKFNNLKLGIGGSAGLTGELGDYYQFRKDANDAGLLKSETGIGFPTYSIFPVIAYRFKKDMVLSTQLNFGIPGLFTPMVVLNNKGNVFWISAVTGFPDSNIGAGVVVGFMINLNKY